jgi:hypothetical protein
MPISKTRKKDERKKRRNRDKEPVAPGRSIEPATRGGMLTRIRGGFQNVAGRGGNKRESLLSKLLTWGLLALVAYFVARRFGIIR